MFWKKINHWIKPLKVIAIIFYILVSQLEQPAFCIHMIQENRGHLDPSTCNNANKEYTNFNWPKLEPSVTRPLEMLALLIMLFSQWTHFQYREFDQDSLWSWRIHYALTIIAFGSMILNFILEAMNQVAAYPWGSAFTRPVIVICQFRTQRQYMARYFKVMYDSIPMSIFIFGYVIYFSWLGQKIFSGSL